MLGNRPGEENLWYKKSNRPAFLKAAVCKVRQRHCWGGGTWNRPCTVASWVVV